jgi:hypothetical protein
MRGLHLEQGTYIPHTQNRSYKLQEQTHISNHNTA